MSFALADAHIHLADLLDRDSGFPSRIAAMSRWTCCAASHDEGEWLRVEELKSSLPPFVSSFGIHPQWAVWKNAEFLSTLAGQGRLAAIGEAGFDFFGDRPERLRDKSNERTQAGVFEFQLDLAEGYGLPLLLHLRKAMDLAFAYAPRLRRLPAAIFHSFAGTASDAQSLLARGVPAYFSFGASLINGNKRAAAACASLPAKRLLSETDAPWQPPRGGDHCRAEDLKSIVEAMASLRGQGPEELSETLAINFAQAFGSSIIR